MQIISDFSQDIRHVPHQSGGYEWWYFDGLSTDGRYGFVIIFYEGNPFSTRYNRALLQGKEPMPSSYPAVSISVYEDGNPVYYSFTEFEKSACTFDENKPYVEIGSHQMEGVNDDNLMNYQLVLEETLANGNSIKAKLSFESPKPQETIFESDQKAEKGHSWNLVQPRAEVRGDICISAANENPQTIAFEGRGYHDHNTGNEPMRDEFSDWYWGRVHFNYATLVYYVMNRRGEEQHQAWLINNDNEKIIENFDEIALSDEGLTLFGLKTAHKIGLRSKGREVQVQMSQQLDNGPFYRRYRCDAFLKISGKNIVERQSGISEYLYPDRIYSRLFWPLVDMRIRYNAEKPHWVQRSKKLYRWTW